MRRQRINASLFNFRQEQTEIWNPACSFDKFSHVSY
jgi:hypothetical protein